ncbi:MAG TPA: ABC transporter substrate-binding protein, partial [Gaiellaceae bacterium]|nr:ABC transporter substrate-binding protein [Gaiellaceae bacterium]
DPVRNFQAFAEHLNQAGFQIEPRAAPWSPDYLGLVDEGRCPLYLLGWTGDYADPDNFIGTFFQTPQEAWGFENEDIFNILDEAEVETEPEAREQLYQEANRLIMDFLPGVPYAHSEPALAFTANVRGYQPSPVSLEPFSLVYFEE